jgi:hypothetical protein
MSKTKLPVVLLTVILLVAFGVVLWTEFGPPPGSRPSRVNAPDQARAILVIESQAKKPGTAEPDQSAVASAPQNQQQPVASAIFQRIPNYSMLFNTYISAAESGDRNAAVLILSLLRDCKSVVPVLLHNSSPAADTEETKPHEGANEARVAHECLEIFDEEDELNAAYDRWYKTVKDSMHPLFLVGQRSLTYEETRSYLLAGFLQVPPEPMAYEQAFLAAARLNIGFADQRPINEVDFYAWQLLACAANTFCDYAATAAEVRRQTSQYLFETVQQRQQELLLAIETQDLGSFGF